MEAEAGAVPHVQAKFVTKQTQHSVPDTPFSVPSNVTVTELNELINELLKTENGQPLEFDFLVSGELLRLSLFKHMLERNISTETVVEVEYFVRHPAPEPIDSLLHDDWVSCVEGSGDYILSGCYDNTVKLWNTEGDHLLTIPAHAAPVKCCAWIKQDDEDPIHRFVTGSHDQSVLLWEWHDNKNAIDCVHVCRGHAGSVDTLAVDPSKSRFCSGSWDRMLKIWSTASKSQGDEDVEEETSKPHKRKKTDAAKTPTRTPLMTLSGHNEGISSAVWLDPSTICTASWDHTIRLWNTEEGVNTSTITGSKVFLNISYSNLNRTVIAASADRHIRLYDPRITDGAIVRSTFTSHNAWVSSVSWSTVDEHKFISGSYDLSLKLWDSRSPKAPLYDMSGHEDKILAVDWSIQRHMLSGAADNTVKIFKYSDDTSRLPS